MLCEQHRFEAILPHRAHNSGRLQSGLDKGPLLRGRVGFLLINGNVKVELGDISRSRLYFCNASLPRQEFVGRFRASVFFPAAASSGIISIEPQFFLAAGVRHLDWRLNAKPRKRSWWKKYLDEFIESRHDEEDDTESESHSDNETDSIDGLLADDPDFKLWKQKMAAMNELKRYRKMARDPNNEDWEDWLDDSWDRSKPQDMEPAEKDYIREQEFKKRQEEINFLRMELNGTKRKRIGPFSDLFQQPLEWHQENKFENGFAKAAAKSTVKFMACLVIVPWLADFAVHDFVLVPFLKRYVDLVPLAARVFDVTDSQKLKKVIPRLRDEETRLRFEADVGLAPPIVEEKLHEHLHDQAMELLGEIRAENRSNFANIGSDMVAGATLLLLLIFNPVQVELMTYSGSRVLSNLSDIGRAFFIILLSDIFLGYHSESGWVTVVELFLEHYGMEATEASVSSFVAIVPVTIDACFKLWVFRNLPRLSPSLTAIFREMERH